MSVEFFILTKVTFEENGSYICQLIVELFKKQRTVYILAPDEKLAKYFDDLLWTFQDISFIPHVLLNQQEHAATAPIQISHNSNNVVQTIDTLINLTTTVPIFFHNFNKIYEIVPADEQLTKAGRMKYKYYQQQKCQIIVHNKPNG